MAQFLLLLYQTPNYNTDLPREKMMEMTRKYISWADALRQKGKIVFECNGCGEVLDTETGDFNGNGMSDILWRDTSGDVAIWFMNGTTIASGTGLGTISTTYTIQGTNAD